MFGRNKEIETILHTDNHVLIVYTKDNVQWAFTFLTDLAKMCNMKTVRPTSKTRAVAFQGKEAYTSTFKLRLHAK
jgi:hypothetical protein